jgi:hypothetical protein
MTFKYLGASRIGGVVDDATGIKVEPARQKWDQDRGIGLYVD